MITLLRWLSVIFFISALASLGILISLDALDHLQAGLFHQQAGALSLMLIGASYISLQLTVRQRLDETLKKVLLGVAFLFWGGEQFLPASPWVTAMDSLVVIIFVVDLGLIIVEHLKRTRQETPSKPSF